ncbi:hypothetical protein DIPPA_22709 [Diplonema papillatum]|nr:hypothetical protein DIPPA_22709 [Diplonema papillatum]
MNRCRSPASFSSNTVKGTQAKKPGPDVGRATPHSARRRAWAGEKDEGEPTEGGSKSSAGRNTKSQT